MLSRPGKAAKPEKLSEKDALKSGKAAKSEKGLKKDAFKPEKSG